MKKSFFIVLSLLISSTLGATNEIARIADYKGNKVCAISYTFDDGLVEQYTLAAPELEKRGFRGTFAINGSKINPDANHILDSTRMTWFQLRDLSDRGHELSNHGWAHKNFSRFPMEEIKADIELNDKALEIIVGHRPRTFVYPNNNMKAECMAIAVQGRVGTRTFQKAIGSKSTPEDLSAWVKELIENKDWGVGMTHGMTYGYDAFADPKVFYNHLDEVKSLEEKIWVDTFEAVSSYLALKESTGLIVERRNNRIMIVPICQLDKDLYTEKLTLLIDDECRTPLVIRQDGKTIPHIFQDCLIIFDFDPFGGVIEVVYPN